MLQKVKKVPEASNITIYEVGNVAESKPDDVYQLELNISADSNVSPQALPYTKIYLDKTYSGYNFFHNTTWVTSVAKGETFTFSTTTAFTNVASVTGGATAG